MWPRPPTPTTYSILQSLTKPSQSVIADGRMRFFFSLTCLLSENVRFPAVFLDFLREIQQIRSRESDLLSHNDCSQHILGRCWHNFALGSRPHLSHRVWISFNRGVGAEWPSSDRMSQLIFLIQTTASFSFRVSK